jgi:ABC-type multidrug transport system ATPase subunit
MNPTYAIETHQLTRRFGKLTAIDSLDLRVPRAAVYGFLGPNGAGKTTTIRTLLNLTKPDSGEIRFFGGPLALERVGALVEMPSLYPHLTGRENLEVIRRLIGAPRNRIEHALSVVKLEGAAHRLVREYSLGMRQRLGIAQALMSEPELLILDEPTNGLDPAGIHEMRALIRQFAADDGITVFVSSHLLNEVEQAATHIGIINGGKLLFQGSLAELHEHQRPRLSVGVDRPYQAVRLLADARVQASLTEGGVLEISSEADAADVNAILVGNGFRVHQLSATRRSLEEIFLALTHEGVIA